MRDDDPATISATAPHLFCRFCRRHSKRSLLIAVQTPVAPLSISTVSSIEWSIDFGWLKQRVICTGRLFSICAFIQPRPSQQRRSIFSGWHMRCTRSSDSGLLV